MRLLFLSFLLLLSPALLAADEEAGQLPPSVPQSAGPVAVKAVLADGTVPVGMPVSMQAASGSGTTTYRLITGREGGVLLQLGSGDYHLHSVLDDMATGGADYASTAQLSVPSQLNLTLVFYPAGSVAMSVLEAGKPVHGAEVHVSCSSDWFDYSAVNGMEDAKSGEAGDFLFRALPVGACVVSASTQASAGSAQVAVEQGKLQNAQVELSSKAGALPDMVLLAAALAIFAAIAGALAAGKRGNASHGMSAQPPGRRAAAPKKARPQDAGAHGAGGRRATAAQAPGAGALDANGGKARAVLSTLSEREAQIVRFLMASGGKSKRSAMQHKLLIPKTSLLRNLRSLERKNIVLLTPFGRNLVAELQRGLFE